MSETEREVAECTAPWELHLQLIWIPWAYLNMGAVDIIAFGLLDEEIELFRRKGLTAVTNLIQHKLASGIANTTAFLKNTESILAHRHRWTSQQQLPDMFREMFLVTDQNPHDGMHLGKYQQKKFLKWQ